MCDYESNYSNPEDLPVEKLTISVSSAGVVRQINALDEYWVDKRPLFIYERPPGDNELLIGALDTWKAKMEIYLDDLKSLLALEHHRFWSTILYHPTSMDMLVSFLQEANPPYMPAYQDRNVQNLYEDIRRLVLVIFSRLVTNKESKSHWMSKEYMGDLIYDKFIFTVPILWDIVLVFGADNSSHVARLLSSVFSLQPKYMADLDAAIVFVKEAFKYIILQVNKDYDSIDPPNLPETFKGFGEIRRPAQTQTFKEERLTLDALRDLVIHLLDTTMTLRLFVEVYPKCLEIFKKRSLVLSIVQLYEYALPHLYEKLDELGDETSITHTELEGYIDGARAELIDVFREMLAAPKNAIFSEDGNIEKHVEDYLATLMEGLSEKLLIKDYHSCYPINDDLEMLKQAYPSIDTVKTDFILQAIYSNLDEPSEVVAENHTAIPNGHLETIENETQPGTSTRDNEIPAEIKQTSLISEVKDIFPELGDGFILKCLQHYSFNSERVIGCILEDNLDVTLRNLDRSLPIIPEDVVDKKFLETGVERLNVFDGDQFDIMTRDDVDLSKIYTGKKREKHKDFRDLLDDKSDLKDRVDIYSKYNLVCSEDAIYSDEYDDTYDDDGVSAAAGDATADDLGRPFVVPRVLAKREVYEEPSEEETEQDETEQPAANKNRVDFCVNPEEMRARREANFRARQPKGHRPPPKTADVVGKPRGQGQEKEVLVSREKKEKHKSSRANHNRRSGAQWKRSQGMMPS